MKIKFLNIEIHCAKIFYIFFQYSKYLIPSLFSFVLAGVYTIVDGFFIGQKMGDNGLAAINFAYPFTALFLAVGSGLGVACAVHYTTYSAQKKDEEALISLILMQVSVLFFALIGQFLIFYNEDILQFFGAFDLSLNYAVDYSKFIIYTSLFQIFAQAFIPILRAINKTYISALAMLTGFFLNLFLDWLFIFYYDFKLAGAAIATVSGQALSFFICFFYIYIVRYRDFFIPLKNKLRSDYLKFKIVIFKTELKNLLILALAPFGLSLSPNIVLIIVNKQAFIYGRDFAVAAYTVLSYLTYMALLLIQAVCDSAQPLFSYYNARNENFYLKILKFLSLSFVLIFACITAFLIFFESDFFVTAFGLSLQAGDIFKKACIYFALSIIFSAFLRFFAAYFYSVQRHLFSYFIIYSELILISILALILPLKFHLQGLWMAPLSAQISIFIFSYLIAFISKKYK